MTLEAFSLSDRIPETALFKRDIDQVLSLCAAASGSDTLPERYAMDYGRYFVDRGDDGTITGIVHYEAFSRRDCGRIEHIAVDTVHQRKGIGRLLLQAALADMNPDCSIVFASSLPDAVPFYIHNGFIAAQAEKDHNVMVSKHLRH